MWFSHPTLTEADLFDRDTTIVVSSRIFPLLISTDTSPCLKVRDGLGRLVSFVACVTIEELKVIAGAAASPYRSSRRTDTRAPHLLISVRQRYISLSRTTETGYLTRAGPTGLTVPPPRVGFTGLHALGIGERHKRAEIPAFNSQFRIHSCTADVIYRRKPSKRLYSITQGSLNKYGCCSGLDIRHTTARRLSASGEIESLWSRYTHFHAVRTGVRVHNYVRTDFGRCEWQLGIYCYTCNFLQYLDLIASAENRRNMDINWLIIAFAVLGKLCFYYIFYHSVTSLINDP